MTYILIMVDKKGACSEVPTSWQIVPGAEAIESSCSETVGFSIQRRIRRWYLVGHIVGVFKIQSQPEHVRRASVRGLVFAVGERHLANAPDDLVDRITEAGAAMVYEER